MGLQRYYEDFSMGQSLRTRSYRFDSADIRIFAALSGLCARIHFDPQYCEQVEALKRVTIPYSLALNVIDGFLAQSVSPDGLSTFHYGYDKTEYLLPIYPGDTIRSEFVVIDKKEKNDTFGVLTFDTKTYNQNGDIVIHHIDKLYVERKPATAPEAPSE